MFQIHAYQSVQHLRVADKGRYGGEGVGARRGQSENPAGCCFVGNVSSIKVPDEESGLTDSVLLPRDRKHGSQHKAIASRTSRSRKTPTTVTMFPPVFLSYLPNRGRALPVAIYLFGGSQLPLEYPSLTGVPQDLVYSLPYSVWATSSF